MISGYEDHAQVSIGYPNLDFHVDELIKPLISVMIDFGVDTQYSCQGDPLRWWQRKPRRNDLTYVLFMADSISDNVITHLIDNHENFNDPISYGVHQKNGWIRHSRKHRRAIYNIEFDDGDYGQRWCIRFPHTEIDSMTSFIRTL